MDGNEQLWNIMGKKKMNTESNKCKKQSLKFEFEHIQDLI